MLERDGERRGVCAVTGAKPAEDGGHMPLDGLRREEQRLRDLGVRLTRGDQREDLALALAERVAAVLLVLPAA